MKTKRKRIFTYVIISTLILGAIVGMNFSKTALAVTGSDTSHAEYGERLKDQTPASLEDASWSWYTGDKSEWVWVDDENSYFGNAAQQTLVARNATATAYDAVTFNVYKRGTTPVAKVNATGTLANFVSTGLANITDSTYSRTITVTAGTGGTVSGSGTYPIGKPITITATPNSGYKFTKWSDGITTSSRSISVSTNTTYTANFNPNKVTITVNAINERGSGYVAGGTASGGGIYSVGDTVTLKATPDGENKSYFSDCKFLYWDDGNTSKSRSITVTENGKLDYTAIFRFGPMVYANKTLSKSNTSTSLPTTAGSAVLMKMSDLYTAWQDKQPGEYNYLILATGDEITEAGATPKNNVVTPKGTYSFNEGSDENPVKVFGCWLDDVESGTDGYSFTYHVYGEYISSSKSNSRYRGWDNYVSGSTIVTIIKYKGTYSE